MTTVAVEPGVEDFLTWLAVEKGRAPNTLAAYRRDLDRYCRFLADRHTAVADATTADVVAFVRSLDGAGLAPASRTRTLVAVRGLHRFLLAEGITGHDPSADADLPRPARGLPKPLSEDEIDRLLCAVEGDDPLSRRDRAIIEMLYGTGVRISELVGVSLGDLDLVDNHMRVLGKGNKERIVPVGRLAAESLRAWLDPAGRGRLEPSRWASRDDQEALLLNRRGGRLSRQGAWGALKRRAATVGLARRLSPHVLRHSCATHMLDHGADIRTVQELLGHASITTTQVYTAVSTERLRAVYLEAHPRARGPA